MPGMASAILPPPAHLLSTLLPASSLFLPLQPTSSSLLPARPHFACASSATLLHRNGAPTRVILGWSATEAVEEVQGFIDAQISSTAAEDGPAPIGADAVPAAPQGSFVRKGRILSCAHVYWDGYDLNQFGREWDCETGEFADGHLPDW